MGGKRHKEPLYGRWQHRSSGERSTLKWNTTSRAQPYPTRWGRKIETGELYMVCAAPAISLMSRMSYPG